MATKIKAVVPASRPEVTEADTRKSQELRAILVEILGSENVYFQPPANVKMHYDAIVYKRSYVKPAYADNRPYMLTQRWEITLIYEDPDSPVLLKLAALPLCSHVRHFVNDNLNHDVFNLYY